MTNKQGTFSHQPPAILWHQLVPEVSLYFSVVKQNYSKVSSIIKQYEISFQLKKPKTCDFDCFSYFVEMWNFYFLYAFLLFLPKSWKNALRYTREVARWRCHFQTSEGTHVNFDFGYEFFSDGHSNLYRLLVWNYFEFKLVLIVVNFI